MANQTSKRTATPTAAAERETRSTATPTSASKAAKSGGKVIDEIKATIKYTPSGSAASGAASGGIKKAVSLYNYN